MELVNILKMIAPGTEIREGIDNILKAKTGALIVIGDGKEVEQLIDGGFNISVDFTSARLYELAKMDGAIVLSEDLKQILYANVQLIPDFSIPTVETGTRHRTAERVSKQTGKIVISISQRREIITIYNNNLRYVLQDTDRVTSKSNQALQTAEKYRNVFDNKINMLTEYEFNDIATLNMVIESIQRAEMVMRIADEVQKSIFELGTEGRLLKMQLDELTTGIEKEEKLIIKDYVESKKAQNAFEEIRKLSYDDLLKEQIVARTLGINEQDNYNELTVYTRGYRILNKVPRMPSNIVENIVKKFKSFQKLLSANIEELDEVDGIGEVRAKTIVQSLKRMQEQFVFDRLLL
ncbi:MAG: DNA integrity scanning diadenylate cyclase DisA [Clostridia bacterium]|nr:DNA integrity scanning diadenylate cyclase DisA [Clostridia bacterium]